MTIQNPGEHLFKSEYGEVIETMSVLDQTEKDYFAACDAFYVIPDESQIKRLFEVTNEHITAFEISLETFKDGSTIEEFALISSNLLALQDQRRADHLNQLLYTNQFTAIKGELAAPENIPKDIPVSITTETNDKLAEYSSTTFQNKVLSHTNLFLKICLG